MKRISSNLYSQNTQKGSGAKRRLSLRRLKNRTLSIGLAAALLVTSCYITPSLALADEETAQDGVTVEAVPDEAPDNTQEETTEITAPSDDAATADEAVPTDLSTDASATDDTFTAPDAQDSDETTQPEDADLNVPTDPVENSDEATQNPAAETPASPQVTSAEDQEEEIKDIIRTIDVTYQYGDEQVSGEPIRLTGNATAELSGQTSPVNREDGDYEFVRATVIANGQETAVTAIAQEVTPVTTEDGTSYNPQLKYRPADSSDSSDPSDWKSFAEGESGAVTFHYTKIDSPATEVAEAADAAEDVPAAQPAKTYEIRRTATDDQRVSVQSTAVTEDDEIIGNKSETLSVSSSATSLATAASKIDGYELIGIKVDGTTDMDLTTSSNKYLVRVATVDEESTTETISFADLTEDERIEVEEQDRAQNANVESADGDSADNTVDTEAPEETGVSPDAQVTVITEHKIQKIQLSKDGGNSWSNLASDLQVKFIYAEIADARKQVTVTLNAVDENGNPIDAQYSDRELPNFGETLNLTASPFGNVRKVEDAGNGYFYKSSVYHYSGAKINGWSATELRKETVSVGKNGREVTVYSYSRDGKTYTELTEDTIITLIYESPAANTRSTWGGRNIGGVIINVHLTDPDAIPAGARLNINPVTPGTNGYDAYMSALAAAGEETDGKLYDIAFYVTGEDGGQVEYTPDKGSVQVDFTFSQTALDNLGADEVADVKIVHLPLDSEAKSSAPTAMEASFSAGNVSVEPVNASVSGDTASASVSGLSTFYTVDGKTTDDPADADTCNLNDFLKDVSIEGLTKSEGRYTVESDTEYKLKLSFAESAGVNGLQFPTDGSEMVYTFPEGVSIPDVASGTIVLQSTVSGDSSITANYRIAGGKVYVKWNIPGDGASDQEKKSWNDFVNSQYAAFELEMSGKFTKKVASTDWGGKADVSVDILTERHVGINKTASYNADTNRVEYTLEVTSTGTNHDVVVTDTFSDGSKLELDETSIVTRDQTWSEITTKDKSTSSNGFSLTIPEIKNGQKVSVYYTSKPIDFSKLTANADGTYGLETETGNDVTVKSKEDTTGDNDHKSSTDFSNKISGPTVSKQAGMQSEIDANGYRTIEWTVTLNEKANVAVGGENVHDVIDAGSAGIMSYSGSGITVERYTKDGSKVGETENITIDGFDGSSTWDWTIPTSDTTPYKYVIKYTTKVKVSELKADTNVKNGVSWEYGSTNGEGKVGPTEDNKVGIDKKVESVDRANGEITWAIDLIVPVGGLSEAYVVDYFPSRTILGESAVNYDKLVPNSISVSNLLDGESFTSSDYIGAGSDVVSGVQINFHKDKEDGSIENGLYGGTASRTVTVTLTTKMDSDYLEKGDSDQDPYGRRFYNQATFFNDYQNVSDNDTATINTMRPEVTKTGNSSQESKNTYPQGIVNPAEPLPSYVYQIQLFGINDESLNGVDVFSFEDKFDSRYLANVELTNPGYESLKWVFYAGDGNNAKQVTIGSLLDQGLLSYSNDSGLIEVKIPSSAFDTVFPKDSKGNYYERYTLEYWLTIKDYDTLAQIKSIAKQNEGGKVVFGNTVSAGDFGSASCDVDYTVPLLEKRKVSEKSNSDTASGNYEIDFEINVNVAGDRIGADDWLTLTDTTTNLSTQYTSIKVYKYGTEVEIDDYSINASGNTITYTLPNETPITIKYTTYVVGTGTVNYSNTVNLYGQETSASGSATVTSKGAGTYKNYKMFVLKYEYGDITKTLPGVKFKLYYNFPGQTSASESGKTVIEHDGKRWIYWKTVTTDENGLATIEDSDGVHLLESPDASGNEYNYLVVEDYTDSDPLKVDGVTYKENTVKYQFQIRETADYTNYYYANQDILRIANSPSDKETIGISVTKKWAGDESDTSLRQPVTVHLVEGLGNSAKILDPEKYDRVLSDSNDWKAEWKDLPYGKKYSVREDAIPGYSTVISYQVSGEDQVSRKTYLEKSGTATITNVRNVVEDEETEIFVKKEWKDEAGNIIENTSADTVTVQVQREVTERAPILFHYSSAETNWNVVDEIIYVDANEGDSITVTVNESYNHSSISINGEEVNTYNYGETGSRTVSYTNSFFINNLPPQFADIQVVHDGEYAPIWREDTSYNASAKSIILSAGNGWKGIFSSLPLSEGANAYHYYAREISATKDGKKYLVGGEDFPYEVTQPTGYASAGGSSVSLTVTNVEENQTGSIKIKKTFEGAPDGADLGALEFAITDPEGNKKTVKYSEFVNDEYVIGTDLPIGAEYSVTEINADTLIANYSLVASESVTSGSGEVSKAGTVISLNNKYEQDRGTLKITKDLEFDVAPDASQDGKVFKVTIKKGDQYLQADKSLGSSAYEWSVSKSSPLEITGLPIGTYTVTETETGRTIAGYLFNKDGNSVLNGSGAVTKNDTATVALKNTYTCKVGSIDLSGEKTSNKAISEDAYQFTIVEASDSTGTAKSDAASKTVVVAKNPENDLKGAFKFSGTNTDEDYYYPALSYNRVGTYYYKITEENGGRTIDGVKYDDNEYIVTVGVTEDEEELIAKVKKITSRTSSNAAKITFDNQYDSKTNVEVTATKELSGKALQAGAYEFVLEDSAGKVVGMAKNKEDGSVTFAPIEYTYKDFKDQTEDGYVYKLYEKTPTEDSNGIKYDRHVATVTVKLTDDGNGKLTADVATNWKSGEAIRTVQEAATFINSYTAEGSTTISANKKLDGSEAATAGQFSFAITQTEGQEAAKTAFNAKDVADRTATNDASGKITFPETLFQYSRADFAGNETDATAVYEITEVNGGASNIIYDTGKLTVTVKLHDNGDGTITATPVYNPASATFSNTTVKSGEAVITLKKSLTGKALTDGAFSFKIEETDESYSEPKTTTDSSHIESAEVRNVGENITFKVSGYNAEGVHYYKITEVLPEGASKKDGVSYDGGEIHIKVTVKKEGDAFTAEVINDGTKDSFTNEYVSTGAVKLQATKKLENKDLTKDEFTFSVIEVKDASGTALEGAVSKEAKNTAASQVSGVASSTFTFPEITFSETDMSRPVRYYKITETIPEGSAKEAGVTYDTHTEIVKVTLTDNGKGAITAVPEYDADGAVFTNSYEASGTSIQLSAKKSLTNRDTDVELDIEEGQFSFSLTSSKTADGSTVNQTKTNAASGADKLAAVTFDSISYDTPGEYVYVMRETSASGSGYMTDPTEYTITVTVTDDKEGSLSAKITNVLNSKTNVPSTPASNEAAIALLQFANTYAANGELELSAKKILSTDTDRKLSAGEFTFALQEMTDDTFTDAKEAGVSQSKNNTAAGDVKFDKISYKSEGKHYYVISEPYL